MERTLLWYRNDLRVDDHRPLREACERGAVLGVVPIDPARFAPVEIDGHALGFAKTGPFRARFWLESIAALRREWEARGGRLIVRVGPASEVVARVAAEWGASRVVCHEEPCREELDEAAEVSAALDAQGARLDLVWGATLYDPSDLPEFEGGFPNVFTTFRKACEAGSRVPAPLGAPGTIPAADALAPPAGAIPTLADLGVPEPSEDPRSFGLRGGEAAGRARMHAWAWEAQRLRRYKETRNGLLGEAYSSKYSPWLAHGCLSPRRVWADVRAYEAEHTRNQSTYWLLFELLWREYFRFLADASGDRLFARSGIRSRRYEWNHDARAFAAWCRGETGVPFVDANQRELLATGFQSNRGRQNTACFLSKYLRIDWRWGAAWFEHCLVDYDPCSNWGNWQYVSGVGNDPRDRVFDVVGQGERYDRDAAYLRLWLPELASLPTPLCHRPWRAERGAGIALGHAYAHALIDVDRYWDERKNERSRDSRSKGSKRRRSRGRTQGRA